MSKTIQYTCTAVVLLGLFVSAQFAFAEHAWGTYHWARTTSSFSLQLKNSMTSQWQSALSGAVADWNQSTVIDFVVQKGTAKRNCAGTTGMVETCNAAYGSNGWLGIAQVWVNGDHITKGVVKLNDTYYKTTTYNTPAWRNSVVCQEIGHILGLDHNDEDFATTNGTCMDYSNNPEPNQHPDAHDYEMLANIYAHTDSFDSYAKVSASATTKPQGVGQNLDLEHPTAWGEVVKRDAHNNPSLYRRELQDGSFVLTHVTWVPGEEIGH